MHRTKTIQQTAFELPEPNAANFAFSNSDEMHVHVPAGSKWAAKHHWHYKAVDTTRIKCVDGALHISTAKRGTFRSSADLFVTPGFVYEFKLDDAMAWSPVFADRPQLPLTVTIVANRTLHRNICSAILDKDLFPHLRSTPLWFKALWEMASKSRRHRLLDSALQLQLQVMYYKHDYHFEHGRIPFTDLFWWDSIPEWAKRWEMRSMLLCSRFYGMTAYIRGRLLYGMKGRYAEYTPSDISPAVEDCRSTMESNGQSKAFEQCQKWDRND